MSTLSKPVAELSADEKRAMLAQLLRKKAGGARSFPLSFGQQRLWFLDQMVPGLAAYNVPLAARFSGQLDIDAFAASLNALVRRHDVLRTTFMAGPDGVPVQVVSPALNLEMPVSSVRDDDEVRRLATVEAQQPFDLKRGPLIRARLLRLSELEHVLLLTLHHIVADGWSLGVLLTDLMAFYEAKTTASRAVPTDLPIQYGDFAVWQRQSLQGDSLDRQLAYWKQRLAGATATLDLPTDHPRPAVQTFRGALCPFELTPGLVSAVRALSKREGCTPFMILLAAFEAVLHRYTGQDDLCVGTPIAGRNRAETEGLVGFFVNTLVLRGDLSGDPSFSALLARVREDCLGAYAHQELPFERLVEELRPERDLSRSALFQVLFVYQNAPLPKLEFGNLKVSSWDVDSGTSKFDLSLFIVEQNEGLRGTLEYSTELFEPATAARLVGHLCTLLEAAATDPHQRLSDLPMLTSAEHRELNRWNETQVNYAQEYVLNALFEQQARRTPDAEAVRYEGQVLSYRELDHRAQHLAAVLQQLGVGPDTPVAVAMERSLELVVALLGILKAGGAYVPLDPDYPRDRLDFMLHDAGTDVLITQSHLREQLPSHQGEVLCLDTGWGATREQAFNGSPGAGWTEAPRDSVAFPSPCATETLALSPPVGEGWGGGIASPLAVRTPHPNPPPQGGRETEARATGATKPFTSPTLNPEHLAYVIYTSGSTGRPKGAQNSHRAICNRLLWMQDAYRLTPNDTVLQKTPYSFDVSVWEFFWPLITGARLVLARPGGHKDPGYLADLIEAEHVSVCHFVPSMLEAFLTESTLDRRCASLRDVMCSGEALSYELQERFFERVGARLHNLYGPTEAAVDVTYWECRRNDTRRVVPIGRPIANIHMHVLDGAGRETPVGVPGELHIGGVGLARGYHNRPELTAEKFVHHGQLGRLYRTGDLGRWLADGSLEYLGRLDHQVKLRGFRVELGEIEAVLCEQPGVRASVVLAREDVPGDKRLVAYVVPDANAPTETSDGRTEQIAQWQAVWEDTYSQNAANGDATFNTIGWNSSYTGLPFSAEEMREWLDTTVARILALRPTRVLEIGCGTGLILFQVAPHCERYVGLDFSEKTLCRLQEHVTRSGLDHVDLLRRAAHEIDDLDGFDTVIINSVTQYFPGIHYFVRVLECAAQALGSGGRIFLGDLRNVRLLDAFHASVQLQRAPASLAREQVRARARANAAHERELLIDPALFEALRGYIPSIDRVEIQLKTGRQHNELTRFRYDAVLHVNETAGDDGHVAIMDWQAQTRTVDDVRRLLQEEPALCVRRVPNARLTNEMMTLDLLSAPDGPATADDLRAALRDVDTEGWDPDEFRALGRELGLDVEVRWSESGGDGCFDVDFRRTLDTRCGRGVTHRPPCAERALPPSPLVGEGRGGGIASPVAVRTPHPSPPPQGGREQEAGGIGLHSSSASGGKYLSDKRSEDWSSFANDPLCGKTARDLVPRLREILKARLPEYMVPSAYVVVENLPLSPNGKVDRKVLPAPEQSRPELGESYVAPRTPIEQSLADLWAGVLGVERVGVNDNFFELGGHSLLATQVISRLRKLLQVELPLRVFFEAPTVAALAERVEAERQAALGLPAAPLRPVARDGELPLSFGQETFWFLDQLEPGSPVFNIDVAVRLRGPLNVSAVEQAINEVVRRHETLRTTFHAVDGRPVAEVAAFSPISVPVTDLAGLPDALAEARKLAEEESRRPFDLERGPLFRVRLLRIAPEDHAGLLTVHHSVFDGWSLGVFLREVGLLYQAACAGTTTRLPALDIQYADYAHWQRQWLESGLMADQLTYWKTQLAGPLPILELPTDRPRPAARSFRGARRMAIIPSPLTEAVQALARREGCTLYMVLLAAFKALLARYSGQLDLCVGTPIAGRNRAETEGLIGFFVNTLVLRTDLSGNPSFRELLHRVREVALEAYAHQELPFEMLVQTLRPERDLSHSALFQVMFILQNAPLKIPNIAGLTSGPLVELADNGTSKFDLTLTMMEGTAGLTGTVEYNTDLFDDTTIERFLGHYQTLLEAIVADAEIRLARIGLLSPAERRQIDTWKGAAASYPTGACIHELFEAQALRTPDEVAVIAGASALTYDALNRRANQLAHQLRALGVGPEVPVGLYLDRTPHLLVAVMGVLKAGGAYVPLDPAYPGERLAAVIEDSGVPVLVTEQARAGELPVGNACLLFIDEEADVTASVENLEVAPIPSASARRLTNGRELRVDFRSAKENLSRSESRLSAQNLAYVIYTSGSTGRPKGVMVEHGSLCNAYHAWNDAYGLSTEVKRHLQMASCAFDVFTGDWVRALASGGTLVLCPREVLLEPAKLYDLMLRERIDCAEFVPAVLRALVQYLEETGGSLDFMRLLVAGSDVWYAGEAQTLRRLCDQRTRLVNSYGLTEATIDSTFHEIDARDLPDDRTVPIGRPFANTEMRILDRDMQPTPVGVPGELYVGGPGLARGYARSPGLTASKFVPDPFNDDPGARLFRTGDLARFLPDGTIELLGRSDDQVKIRGYRIELGEIEAVLGQHPVLQQVAVVARNSGPGSKRLVAYVAADEPRPSAHELRAFLRDKLPDYMVPSSFLVLDRLPLTPNGKIDRRSLPAEPDDASIATAYVAPRTPVEELVADVWARVLGVERVGAEDNFFDLGGHSLLATQVISRLSQACQVELPLRRLFETPTVQGLAESIEVARRAGRRPQPPLRPRPPGESAPLSFAQQRLWFLDRFEPESPFYNIPAAARLSGELNVDALKRALREIVKRHEILRTTFQDVDGKPVATVTPEFDVPLPVVDVSGLQEPQVEARRLAQFEAQRPFALDCGPMLRTVLFKLAPREHVVVLVMHHVASDGWSMGVFFRELMALYGAFTQGYSPALPPLPVQYGDYAAWQRNWLQDEPLEEQLAYWKSRLANAPAALELPTDRPRPPLQSVRGGTEPLRLPPVLHAKLKELCRREGCTLHMALLAVFQTLLHRYSGQEDISVGTPVAGRTRPELEGLIGFFVNTLVLRTDLSENPTFEELLERVRETALGAYAHQDVPFELVVEALQPQRDLSRTPLFQVMFILQNTPRPPADLPGLVLSPIEADSGTAKFDLTLALAETEQGLAGNLEYNTDLFDPSTARRLLSHFQNLLESAVAHPAQPISKLAMLDGAERRKILVDWNATAAPLPKAVAVHQLFEEQAERTPDAVALGFGAERFSYRELNERANRLAHHLRRLLEESCAQRENEIRPVTSPLVALCVERSPEMVVALLAILKAGAGYVPLDPSWPEERLAFMRDDAGAVLAITEESLAELWEELDSYPTTNPATVATSEALAYVIYTSGSTGRPKGVEISHGALINFLASMRRQPGLVADDTLLAVTTLSFDIAALEIFLPLTVGASVHIVPREVAQDGPRLAETLSLTGATVMQATPATWRMLVESGWEGSPGLKVLCGGESLSRELGQQLLARSASVWNLYGPTETTVWSTLQRVVENQPISIGRPIANTQVYVVDGHGQPVPEGVPGELLIGGAGVARGYHGRPELTAQKFIDDPFSGRPGARLYRTGDRVRWLADGTLEYLGRIDHQVKIRGFRIEPGEIEAAVRQHPGVSQAVVHAIEDRQGDKRLVAYVVADMSQPGIEAEHVAHWQDVWNQAYVAPSDTAFNTSGWNSSFTGRPYDEAEMREWVDRTVERIEALEPCRILEIGCGTGLLLFRLIPHCAEYTATDVSAEALATVQDRLASEEYSATLLQRTADDFKGIDAGSFDAVVLNSVIQYFPSMDYLARVLEGAVASVRPGGFVFVGDVRNKCLIDAFHATVLHHKDSGSLAQADALDRVRRSAARESELLVEPAFFDALKICLPAITRVDALLKRGTHMNEMNTFRYDVILHVGGEAVPSVEPVWLDYGRQPWSPSEVETLLNDERTALLAIANVPNARIPVEVRTLLREDALPAVDPEEFWALGDRLPYSVFMRWSPNDDSGRFDVVFRRHGTPEASGTFPTEGVARSWGVENTASERVEGSTGCVSQSLRRAAGSLTPSPLVGEGWGGGFPAYTTAQATPHPNPPPQGGREPQNTTTSPTKPVSIPTGPWSSYGNDPLRALALRALVPSLREHLKTLLPDYMIPSRFVVLDALPMTPNGKVDRKSLPSPDQIGGDPDGPHVAPRDETEEQLAAVWCEVLGLPQVGVHDNFFDLGGHSLQAVQLVSRASKAFGRELPVKLLFMHPTVASLAEAINSTEAVSADQPVVPFEAHLKTLDGRIHIERRPLLPLFESGAIAPVDSAAIGYLPSALLGYTGLSASAIIDGWCGNRPIVSGLYQTPMGRIGLVLLPRFDTQLYQDASDLLNVLGQALDTCRTLGARNVSLTGLLPSATRYGEALAVPEGLTVTHGHATTTAAVILAIRRILAEAGRDLRFERLGCLGLGSIGTAVLRTLLECLPHPSEIRLCDVYGKRSQLHELRRELIAERSFLGAIHVLESSGTLPEALYDSTLIVGATNVPDVLDVDRLAPGTLLVDDSSPHAFRLDRAMQRVRTQRDILFTEGGTLYAPEPLELIAYVPAGLEQVTQAVPAEFFANYDAHQITGCVLSSLLSVVRPELPPVVGAIGPETCLAHYQALEALGFAAPGLHCGSFAFDDDSVQTVRRRFGGEARAT